MFNQDKADKADKARVEIRKIFFILEVEKLIPEVPAEIPNIGAIENLYQYTFECMGFCLGCKDFENEYFIFSISQLAIIFDYLQSNKLITSNIDLSGFLIKETTPAHVPEALPTMAIVETEIVEDRIINTEKLEIEQAIEVPLIPQPSNLWDLNFDFTNLPTTPIRINSGEVVENPAKCIASHMEILTANNGNSAYLPYYKRLLKIYETIKQQ